jgi:hypothetical protein
MTRQNWLLGVPLSAIAYVLGTLLFRYLVHRIPPAWSQVPDIAVLWFFFALAYFGLTWLSRRRQKRRAAVPQV